MKAERDRIIAAAHYGDARRTYEETVVSWAEHHIPHHVAPLTARRYAVSLRQLEPHLLGLYLDQVDRALVSEVVEIRRASGASTATIRRDLTALSSVLEYAIDQEWRDDNPALAKLRRLKERRDPIVLPDQDCYERVLRRAPPMLAALARTARATGCRQAELVWAERAWLDHGRRQITVRGKGNKVRVVDLDHGDGYDVLRMLPVRLGCRWLFWHGDGDPYRNVASRFAAIVRAEAEASARAGQPFRPFTFHHLRHLHAAEWLKAGGSIYDLQLRLGHESIKTTEMYLRFLTPDEARRAKAGSVEHQGEQGRREA